MKKFTFFFLLLMVSFGYSQVVVLEDFEGTPPAVFGGFEGLASAATIVDPADAGNTVLELVSASSGQPWQGAEVLMQSNYMDVSTSTITVEVDVYSAQAFNLFGKLEGGVDGAPDSAAATAYTDVGNWQTITITFDNPIDTTTENANGDYEKIAFFLNWEIGVGWNNPAGDFSVLIDNISAVEGAAIGGVVETCDDGVLNNGETEIDCGGPNCDPCTSGSLTVLENFEGTPPAVFAGFEGLGGAATTVDPTDAGNTVLELVSASSGQPWQGAEVLMQSNYMDVSTSTITVEVDVYSAQAFNLFGKVEGGVDGAPDSAAATAYTDVGNWQTITLTFDNPIDTTTENANGDYEKISFFLNWEIGVGWNNPAGDFIVLIDNISAVEGAAIGGVVETCDDGILNNGEIEIDCGGPNCDPCTTGSLEVLEDFEGTPPAVFGGFEGLASAATIVDPADAGNTVLELVSASSGQPWQGAEVLMQSNYMDVSTGNITVEVDVYSAQAFNLFGKLESGVDGAPDSATATAYTDVGNWQTITLTFDNPIDTTTENANGDYEKIAFFLNWNIGVGWNNPAGDFTVLIDNISAVQGAVVTIPETCDDGILNNGETEIDCGGPNCDSCLEVPTDAPPTPPARDAGSVISIYGDAYGPEVGLNNVPWDDVSEFIEETIAGNDLLKVDFADFVGSDLGSIVDASSMTHFHMDYWVADEYTPGQVFNVKWSNHAGGAGETDAGLLNIAFDGSEDVQNWVSIDVPLSDFQNVFGAGIDARAELTQFILAVAGLTKRVYVDNIYFHKNTTLGTDEFDSAEFKVYPNPTATNWTISGNTTITKVTVYDVLGKEVSTLISNDNEVKISTTNMSAGMYFARIESINGSKTVKLIKE